MARSARARTITPATRHAALVLLGYTLFFTLFFAPVLFSARVLAPGDGISYFLPSYYVRPTFWDASIWGGFPAVADAQRMFWYPPALLLSQIPRSWDLFIVSAYVLAGSFTYGYVFSLTRSRLSAVVSGLIYGLCGFMIAHVGHAAIVHTVAWLPLVVWSLAQLAQGEQRPGSFWFSTGALAVACAALAGHPQMFVYTLGIGVACALVMGWRAPGGCLRYYVACALLILLGTGLAAVQLVPTAELTRLSLRAALTFPDFVAYELPLRQVPMLVFPFVYGGAPDAFYATPYFGAWPSSADGWGASELTGYAGLLPLLLACTGLIAERRRRVVWLWAGIALLAVLLALGEATPLARLTYHLPVVNKFRAPARYLFAFAFAVSVLAGLGISALQRQTVSSRLLRRVLTGVALTLAGCLLALKLFAGKLNELALQRLGHTVSLNPFTNPALFVPLLIFIASTGALLYWHRRPGARARCALLVAVLLVDLSSFAWHYEWRYRSPYAAYLAAPTVAATYRAQLDATHERLLPIRGGTGRVAELPPNLSQLWGLPSASGYGPFILARTSRLLTMPPHGSVDAAWRDPANQSLDLMAVRYLLVPPAEVEPPATTDAQGVRWAALDFNVRVGRDCATHEDSIFILQPATPAPATRIGLVSALACSVELNAELPVATLMLTDVDGRTADLNIVAGRDSSEWAYDCADVRPAMRHARAPVFRSYPAVRGDVRCAGHDYVTMLPVAGLGAIRRLELRWHVPVGNLVLKKLTLIDDATRSSQPINPADGSLSDPTRWQRVGESDAKNSGYGPEVKAEDVGAAVVFENLRARPRVWLASEVLTVGADEAFAAVRTSRLPDGRAFDPARTALVEEPAPFAAQTADASARARVRLLTADTMEVVTEARAPTFLVTSDAYYPGWRATLDGAPAHLYQTDYALRGVALPAGTHVVRFEFRPRSFYYGASASALALLLLCGCALWLRARIG